METFYSFVVDKNPSFYYQGWILANSLIKNSNISPDKIIVNAVKGVDEKWLEHFKNIYSKIGKILLPFFIATFYKIDNDLFG